MKKYCEICPRKCRTNREESQGFCGAKSLVRIGKVMVHNWEEPIISGKRGSGAIFFSGCSLKCIYCQNFEISSNNNGKDITIEKLADIFKQLEAKGVHNINLITPTHYTNEIIKALKIYRPKVPIVWNTSGYETVSTVKKLKKYVDIYLTDFKYYSPALSKEYSNAEDYFDVCSRAVLEMRKNQPVDIIEDDLMKKGLIVRHLILPGTVDDSSRIFNWIAENLGSQTYVSLMNQYTPYHQARKHRLLKRRVRRKEYEMLFGKIIELGFENGFVQEKSSSSCQYIPNFSQTSDGFDY